MTYVRFFISLAVTSNWDLHQLDIKNVFLHGKVYTKQPLGFVAQREKGLSSLKVFIWFETKSTRVVW